MKNCSHCNAPMGNDDVFCMSCGQKNENSAPAEAANSYAQQPGNPPVLPQVNPGFTPAPHQAPAKKRGCLKGCLITALVLLLVGALFFTGAFFLLPGLFRPADLGVEASEQAYASAHDKLGYSKDQSPQAGERSDYITEYSGSHPINASLTSEEMTSMFAYNRSVYTRFEKPQVRFNPDGTVDASVRVNLNYVFQEMLMGRYDQSDLRSVFPAAGILPANINLQGNFEGRVVDNQLDLTALNSMKIQGISVPQKLLSSADTHQFVESTINTYIQTANERTGTSYDLIEVRSQELVIQGMFPDSITRRTR